MALINIDKVLAQLVNYMEGAQQGLAAGMFQEAEKIMAKSKEVYVPIDTGVLKSTGHVEPPVMSGDRISVTLAFGGPAATYATAVHEDLTAWHREPTRAKYLETAVNEALPGMDDRIGVVAERVAKARAGG